MKRSAFVLVLCGVVLLACGPSERRTQNRVTVMMNDWVSGGTGSGGDIQEAVCLWYNGKRILPLDHLKHARDRFDDWRREKGLYRKIGSWDITDITTEAAPQPTAMIVSIDIDNKPYRMRVETDEPISWVD